VEEDRDARDGEEHRGWDRACGSERHRRMHPWTSVFFGKNRTPTEQPKAEQVGFYFYPGPISSHYWKTEFSPHRKNRTELSV
jgi:hypothetical protein